MKFSLEWIKEYGEVDLDGPEVGSRLTSVGIQMDSMEQIDQDVVLDFDVTTNRPDCMNHYGLAREMAVATRTNLKEIVQQVQEAEDTPAGELASIEIADADLCSRYTARVIVGVQIGPSPEWLARRLHRIGHRPINAIVDATNYVLWELGHPLHAFDLDRLEKHRILVRRARPGEPFTTLDGIARKLDRDMLVIADAKRPVALAGVMGGLDSEISDTTANVLLESAHFDPMSVRKTAKKLGLHTDASHRFERGTDAEITALAADRCAQLITQVAGGRVAKGILDCRAQREAPREVLFRPGRAERLLGMKIPHPTMKDILQRLGCVVAKSRPQEWQVTIPSFRGDVSLEEDLIEEIARHHGYDQIPTTLPRIHAVPEGCPETEKRTRSVRQTLLRGGFSEALNLSLVSGEENSSLADKGEGLQVANPLAQGQDHLRTTLLPGLLRNLAHNLNHGALEVYLFEMGSLFHPSPEGEELPHEEPALGLVCGGKGTSRHWSQPVVAPDLFDLKGALEMVLHFSGLPIPTWVPGSSPFLISGSVAELHSLGGMAGKVGQVEPSLARKFGLEEPAYVAEVSIDSLLGPVRSGPNLRHTRLSRTPTVSRDLSFLMDAKHPYSAVEETIRGVEGIPLTRVSLTDRYQGKPVPPGKVSMTVNLLFQDPQRTLLSEEVAEALERIIEPLCSRLQAVLRKQ